MTADLNTTALNTTRIRYQYPISAAHPDPAAPAPRERSSGGAAEEQLASACCPITTGPVQWNSLLYFTSGSAMITMSVPVLKEEDGAPSVWEFLLRNADDNTIATCFLSESKAVGERLLAHNASDKDKKAVAHFLYHTGAVSIQVQAAPEESKSEITDSVPSNVDSKQRISPGADVQIETKDDNPEVTVQSSVDYPTNPPGSSTIYDSGAMDDDASDDNGYALWDQDLQIDEEETPIENSTPKENATAKENAAAKENTSGVDRTDGGLECQNCHTWFRHTWDYDIHRLQSPAQCVPSVYACNQCGHIRKQRFRIITHIQKVHNVPLAEILAKIEDLKIPKSDIASMKIQIHKVTTASPKHQMKSYACDRCDFTHNGQEPIIKHLQEEHKLTLAETLSEYRKLEVPVSKVETNKRGLKRIRKSRKRGRPRKIIGEGNIQNAKKRKIARSIKNCGRNSSAGTGIVLDLCWRDIQDHETATDEEVDSRRVPPEKLKLRTLSIKLRDIRMSKGDMSKGDTTFEANSQVEESAGEPVGHTAEIVLSTTEHGDMNKEMEAKLEESEDKEQAQASEEDEDKEQTQGEEEPVTKISPTDTSEDVNSISSKATQHNGRKSQKCEICGRYFKFQHRLFKHISVEHLGMSYTCSTCNRVFNSLTNFRLHIQNVHKNRANGKVFQCDICHKTFSHESTYNAHKRSHGKKNACEVCGKIYASPRAVKAHLNREHTKEKLFTCAECNKTFYDRKALQQHMHCHSERQCECDVCHKKFYFMWEVNRHKQFVLSERSHLCEICGSCFKTEAALKDHSDFTHNTEYRFKCEICGRGFKRPCTLRKHRKSHTDIKPYPCEICGKNFRTRRHLQVHTNWHNNVRDFVCKVCGKAFLTKTNLDKHFFTHTGRKPHPCTECDQQFVDRPGLRHHLLKKHGVHLERNVPRKTAALKTNKAYPTDLQIQQIPSAPRTVVEPVHSSVVSGQPAQFDVVSSAVTASGINEEGLKTAEQVSEDLQPPVMTAQSLPQHSNDIDDNMIATETLMQIIMS
ncbi:uncharacterized protein [Diadema setosum]|uniref:uncharacterized protein n=1 Tax=Diadema setosum TaxID=31175 RepID=UPI003B3A6DDC